MAKETTLYLAFVMTNIIVLLKMFEKKASQFYIIYIYNYIMNSLAKKIIINTTRETGFMT